MWFGLGSSAGTSQQVWAGRLPYIGGFGKEARHARRIRRHLRLTLVKAPGDVVWVGRLNIYLQVVLLRAQHGYRRPPGVTTERLLRGAGEVTWAPGLGDAARPAAAQLRQALLGWTRTEPVPASEAFARDAPTWRSQADAGEEPAWRPAPSTPLPPHWEVEDGPTGNTRVACVLGYADRSLHSSFRHPSDPSLAVWLCFSDSHLRVARRAVTTASAAPARGWRHP